MYHHDAVHHVTHSAVQAAEGHPCLRLGGRQCGRLAAGGREGELALGDCRLLPGSLWWQAGVALDLLARDEDEEGAVGDKGAGGRAERHGAVALAETRDGDDFVSEEVGAAHAALREDRKSEEAETRVPDEAVDVEVPLRQQAVALDRLGDLHGRNEGQGARGMCVCVEGGGGHVSPAGTWTPSRATGEATPS